jgi:hypothetical protein
MVVQAVVIIKEAVADGIGIEGLRVGGDGSGLARTTDRSV